MEALLRVWGKALQRKLMFGLRVIDLLLYALVELATLQLLAVCPLTDCRVVQQSADGPPASAAAEHAATAEHAVVEVCGECDKRVIQWKPEYQVGNLQSGCRSHHHALCRV